MEVNVTRLRLTMREVQNENAYAGDKFAARPSREIMLTIDVENESGTRFMPMLHSRLHILELIDQLRGHIFWREKHAFPDGNYYIEGNPEGFKIHYDGKNHYFCIPGSVVASYLNELWPSYWRKETEYEFRPADLANLKDEYKPIVKVEFTDDALARWESIMHPKTHAPDEKDAEAIAMFAKEHRDWLKRELEVMKRWAAGYSNGRVDKAPAIVSVMSDFVPASFYIEIRNPRRVRVYSGGWICSANRDKDRKAISYEYSAHS